MSAKRKRNVKAEQLAALQQRITDIYSGAMGQAWTPDEWATADILSNVMPVLRSLFDNDEQRSFLWSLHNLKQFDTPIKAAEFLFSHGVRA